MVVNELNLSLNEPYIRAAYAKQGDSGRVYKVNVKEGATEDGTLRIKRPDGVEVTSSASSGGEEVGTSFTTIADGQFTSLEMGIEPIQDLHGYDNPYPAGGGKNLASPDNWSQGYINTSGALVIDSAGAVTDYIPIDDSKTYVFSGTDIHKSSGGSTVIFVRPVFYNSSKAFMERYTGSDVDASITFTPPSGASYVRMNMGSNATDIQLEIGSSPTAYAPYSNICPIYPFGKNLFNESDTDFIAQEVAVFGTNDTKGVAQLNNLVAGTYTLSFKAKVTNLNGAPSVAAKLGLYLRATNSGTNLNVNGQIDVTPTVGTVYTKSVTFTLTNDYVGKFTSCWPYTGKNTNVSPEVIYTGIVYDVQIERGSTATSYVPYNTQTVMQSGKNFFEFKNVGRTNNGVTYTLNDDGTLTLTNTASGTSFLVANVSADMLTKIPKGSYILSGAKSSNIRLVATTYNVSGSSVAKIEDIATDLGSGATFTLTEDSWVGVNIRVQSGQATNVDIKAQIEKGSTATTWEQFNREEYNSILPQLVYGGTLDVAQGKLTVEWTEKDLGDLVWTYNGTRFASGVIADKKDGNFNLICSQYKTATASTVIDMGDMEIKGNSTAQQIYVKDSRYSDANVFLTAVRGVQLVYELATPTVIDLTPQQISTLLGENNIFSDSGDVVEVSFTYDGMYAELPSQATSVVGRCIGDVELNGVSTMPFTLVVQKNNQA